MNMEMTFADIEAASTRVSRVIHQLPLASSLTFSNMTGGSIYLKPENKQKTGSFKVRGAYNKIAALVERGEKPVAVVASSAGNHAQGVAYAATSLGIPSTIVMPRSAPLAKVSATEGYGAKVVLYGDVYDDAYEHALELCEAEGAVFIHPFDDTDIIAGQGTIGLEILKELPTVDVVLVPAGGGGLLAGIAFCIKEINPRVKVIGVQAEGADALVQCFQQQTHVQIDRVQTIADGIAVKCPGTLTARMINQLVDDMVTVTDEEIAAAILYLLERDKQVVEPAGAASLAAALSERLDLTGKNVACVLSGGNIDVSFIHRVVEKGLINRGRQIILSTVLEDIPGTLEKVARIVGKVGANIIGIQHDRTDPRIRFDQTVLDITCEVSGVEHGRQLIKALEDGGYPVTIL